MNLETIEYHNSPERFSEFRKKLFLTWTAFMVFSMAVAALIFFFTGDSDFAGSVVIPLLYFVFILVVLVFSMFRSIRQQKVIYLSYRLVINEQAISREQSNLLPVKIPFDEITEITETHSGHVIIKGIEKAQVIVISTFVENFEQLKDSLRSVHQLSEAKPSNIIQQYPAISSLLMVGSWVALYVSTNRLIAATGGLISLAILLWTIYKIRTEKRGLNLIWLLIVVFLSIATTTYFKLFPIK